METNSEQTKYSSAACRLEAEYIANLRHLFHHPLTIVHPTTNEAITFKDWSVVEQVEDESLQLARYLNVSSLTAEQQATYPVNSRVTYWIEPNSLGAIFRHYPKAALIIECAVLSRLEHLVRHGHDEEKLRWCNAEQELLERQTIAQRWSLRYDAPVVYLLGLASTTGWDEASIARTSSYADNQRLTPYLIDLVEQRVYPARPAKAETNVQEIFEMCFGATTVKRIQQQIRELLLATGVMSVDHLQAHVGYSQGLIRAACLQLAKSNPDYRILQEGNRLIIRST